LFRFLTIYPQIRNQHNVDFFFVGTFDFFVGTFDFFVGTDTFFGCPGPV
jgi:hypothetical protein